MNAIVSVTKNWGIGLNGQLVVRNRDDMRFFKQKTMGGTVICGRKTFESFPGGALVGRHNIVLSRSNDYTAEGVDVVHDIEGLLRIIHHKNPEEVWVIGGARVYDQLLPMCTTAYVTWNDASKPVDSYFPNLDERPDWELKEVTEGGVTPAGVTYEFRTYSSVKR